MKHFSYLIILIVFSVQTKAQIWSWQSPTPQGNTLTSTYFYDADTGFSIGTAGTVLKTIDGGESWERQFSNTESHLYGANFLNDKIGYAVGHDGVIIKTTNGGNEWIKQNSGTSKALLSVFFVDENIGYATGIDGVILKTINGGDNWEQHIEEPDSYFFSSYFINSDTGYIGGSFGIILKTVNGGVDWVKQTTNNFATVESLFFINSNVGYAGDDRGRIYKTLNGGTTWTAQQSGTLENIKSIYFLNENKGYACGGRGTVLHTTNGGSNWTSVPDITINSLFSISFGDNNTGYIVGYNGALIKTINGGIDWTVKSSGPTNNLRSISFPSSEIGYAVGDMGIVLKTTNKGKSWAEQVSGTTKKLNSVFFINEIIGYSGGDDGLIIKTLNGGLKWDTLTSGATTPVQSLFFLNSDTGFAVTSGGAILKTINGGTDWIKQKTFGNTLLSVYFSNANIGCAVGMNGYVTLTDDGGNTWESHLYSTNYTIYDVFFTDIDTAYAVGKWGEINKTSDGGKSWDIQVSGTGNNLRSVHFISADTGYAVGDEGVVLKTCNGGAKWDIQNKITRNKLYDITFSANRQGYAVGNFGAIHSTSAGTISAQNTYAFIDTSIYEGDSILVNGKYLLEEGVFYDTLPNYFGADSIITINLVIVNIPELNDCEIVGIISDGEDFLKIVTFNPLTGVPDVYRTIQEGFVMEEYPGVFNPKTRNFVEMASDYMEDSQGIFIVNFDSGGIRKYLDDNKYISALTYDYNTNKIYAVADYYYEEVDSDSTFLIELNDITGEVQKLEYITDGLYFENSIYTYNPVTQNIIMNWIDDLDYIYTINVNSGDTYINETSSDILNLFYDADSNSVYGIESVSDTLKLFKLNELTGERTNIKSLGKSIISYPWPYDKPAYNQDNKTVYMSVINEEENDNSLLMINILTGEMRQDNFSMEKYGGPIGIIQYACPVESGNEVNDSIIHIQLSEQACNSYTSPSGKYTWTKSGIYKDTINKNGGCYELITVNLTVDEIDTSVTISDRLLTSNQSNARFYQWYDCESQELLTEYSQTFIPKTEGKYCVFILMDDCTASSSCYDFSLPSSIPETRLNNISFYPVPTKGNLTIDFGYEASVMLVNITSLTGQVVYSKKHFNTEVIDVEIDAVPGVYILQLENAYGESNNFKLLKN